MQQFENFGDQRSRDFCVHCGGDDATRDHTPSKALLDRPLPENLPVAPACRACNNGFSEDEEYLSCLLECVIYGSTDPGKMSRPTVVRALEQNLKLQRLIEAGRKETDAGLIWDFDRDRVCRVLLKLARGHIAFELNEPRLHEPRSVWFGPLEEFDNDGRDAFEQDSAEEWSVAGWAEVGSRAMQRLLIAGDEAYLEPWLVVQEGRYRYRVDSDDGSRVRMVLSEYLACIIVWD